MREDAAGRDARSIRSEGRTGMSKQPLCLGAIALLAAACATAAPTGGGGGATPGSGGGSTPGGGGATASTGSGGGTGGGGNGGAAVAEAAAKLTDVCAVMPKAAILALVPDAGAPASDGAYHQCTMSNGKTAVQITISGGFGEPDPPNPGEAVGDLGQKAWIQEQTVDDAYLVIFLGVTGTGSYESLFLEYAGHDGKAHRNDAIGIAKATIAALQ
jgi:hypothetical protein